MPSVQRFRQFFNERLAAAAEEIFSAFEKTILEYEEEISRQRKLLDIAWKPAVKLPRIELPQQLACKEEEVVAIDHQLIHQERNSRLDQQGPELPQVKEELCTSQDREYLVLKQETDTFMVPHTYEKGCNTGDPTLCLNLSESENLAEKESLVKISIKTPEEAELNSNHQFFSHSSCLSKSREIEGKPGNAETKPQKIPLKGNYVHNPAMLMNYCETHTSQKSFKCDTCGKTFPFNSKLIRHLRIHTGVRPYSCNICGKRFNQTSILNVHKRIHTGERPYSCNICGKRFNQTSILNVHKRTHTGEKPYSCNICGKRFNQKSILDAHVRIHTGEKPFSCKTCGKCLRSRSSLLVHMKTHRGEQPYSCERWDVSGVTIL